MVVVVVVGICDFAVLGVVGWISIIVRLLLYGFVGCVVAQRGVGGAVM